MSQDYTVQIFDQFYNLNLVVDASEYEVVLSFFNGYTDDAKVAKSFTENLFRISNMTQIPVLELLQSFQGSDSMKVSLTMAYYLNSVSNKTTMFGVTNVSSPNNVVSRNIVQ
jgi:hypothetical protein